MDLTYVRGVGPRRAELLKAEIGVSTVEELLAYYPYRYVDRSHVYRISDINGAMPWILLRGRFTTMTEVGEGKSRRLSALFTDDTGTIECVWFHGIKYIQGSVERGKEYMLYGQPKEFNHSYNIAHPDLDAVRPADDDPAGGGRGLYAMYNTTERMKRFGLISKAIQRIVTTCLEQHPEPFGETLPAYIVEPLHLMPYNQAIRQIHFPATADALRRAQYRLKLDELIYLQLYLIRSFRARQTALAGWRFVTIGQHFNDYYRRLPFALTDAQKRVIREIRADVGSGRQMNRLLQGDVGSGKTMVATLTMLMALDNGFQACLMAPTEILASQHYDSLRPGLEEIGVSCALLTGSTPKRKRDKIHEGLRSGQLDILIGTHALLEPTVQFRNLGIAVIDEQHRFGVEQRSRLWAKNTQPPHVLVMTATPIPRTLAMTIYGDLDVSVIDQLPPGRKPIQTLHLYDDQQGHLLRSMRRQLALGRQIYVVYPIIEENEKLQRYKAVEEGFLDMQRAFGPEYRVAMVHGRMKPADKDAAMHRFATGEAHILVATTVIEVGVNVPNASVMVIMGAGRFGLSQLHQLRGRVGRGADQSYCVLVTDHQLSADTRKRIDIMCETTDGFRIAEADLKLRGPGDMEGTLQSGLAFDLKIASLAHDEPIVRQARDIALGVLERDPNLAAPANALLRRRLNEIFAGRADWSRIS